MMSFKDKLLNLKNKTLKIAKDYKIIFSIYILLAIVASFQSYFAKSKTFDNSGARFSNYNNYIIFKQSFNHLTENKDLYILYPKEHWDLYKYTPSFSVLFAPFAVLPDLLGLTLWNLLNALLLFFAIKHLPGWLSENKKKFVLWFIVIELMTSIQNEQSNGLIAGLIIFAYVLLERKKILFATLLISIGIFIKPFGLVALPLLLLFPEKLKSILFTIGWSIILFFIPLLIVSYSQLIYLYGSWGNLLIADHSASVGLSVMGWLHTWFGLARSNTLYVTLLGVVLFCLPLFRFKMFNNNIYKLLLLSSILVWVIIFNHKAESPTFVIAIAGVALWYVSQQRNVINIGLLILAFIFASLSPTDIFPRFIRNEYVNPYMLKAVPCILIWFKILYDQLFLKTKE